MTCLSTQEFFTRAVLQGGTAPRLFYGNPRFSEDLGFALRGPSHQASHAAYANAIEAFVRNTFTFPGVISVTAQKQTPKLERVILRTRESHPAQNLRLNLKLAAVPSYSNTPRILNHPPPNPAVRVESLPEILADKVTAFN